jgi:hypothetical protein
VWTAHEQEGELPDSRCDFTPKKRNPHEVSVSERSEKDASLVHNRLPSRDELRNAVRAFFEEVRNRVLDRLRNEARADLSVVQRRLL